MATNRTFTMIKPDATAAGNIADAAATMSSNRDAGVIGIVG